jgi:hypothetical protein
MTKAEQFKNQFADLWGAVNFFTDDCEQVNFIDVEADLIEFTISFTASCGCCNEFEECTDTLSDFFERMSDTDFEMLTKQLSK